MSDFRELAYRLEIEWRKATDAYNKRPGADYASKINSGSGTKASMTDGKPEITYVEAKLHHSGRILGEVSIIVNYDSSSFDIFRPNHEVRSVPAQNIDIPGLVTHAIFQLTEAREHSR